MSHWSTFVVILASFAIMMTNIDGLVYNVCTSDGPHGINSIPSQNLSHTGISIKILKINPSGSVDIQVSSDKKIKDITLWAEYKGKSKKERHIGTFRPIVGHAYIKGCDGPYNSTITNFEDLDNTSQIIYEWDPPPGTKMVFKYGKKKSFPGEKGHKLHHHHHNNHNHKDNCHKDKKKYKKPNHGNKKKHHKNKNHHHHKSHHHRIINKFTFKGVAFLEDEPFKFYVFTLDKPIYVQGKLSSSNTSLTSPSTLPEGESTDTRVDVGSFDGQSTSSSQSNKRWNGRGMTAAISFLLAGMLIL